MLALFYNYNIIKQGNTIMVMELSIMHKCTVVNFSFVMTWDGIVTNYYNVHVRKIGIDINTKAYIQSIVPKKSLEAISFDYRRHSDARGIKREVAIDEAFEEIAASVDVNERDE